MDVAIFGNIKIWPWSSKYRIVFGGRCDTHFAKLSTFSEFRALSRPYRLAYRAKWWLKLTALSLVRRLRDPGKAAFTIMNAEAARGRVVFARFDSTAKLWLASGRVAHDAILSLDREIERMSRDSNTYWL